MNKSVGVAMLGMGVVGSGVAEALFQKSDSLTNQIGAKITLMKLLKEMMLILSWKLWVENIRLLSSYWLR